MNQRKENRRIWYYMVLLPFFADLFSWIPKPTKEQVQKIKRVAFIYGIYMPTRLPKVHDDYQYYDGQIRLHHPIILEIGKPVMTSDGIGRIVSISSKYSSSNKKIVVEMMQTNYKKSKGYIKRFRVESLSQLVVYHKLIDQFMLLTPMDYIYITDENQRINYRITNRGFAKLSPHCRSDVEYIKIFNNYKNGNEILKRLLKEGYVILKQ